MPDNAIDVAVGWLIIIVIMAGSATGVIWAFLSEEKHRKDNPLDHAGLVAKVTGLCDELGLLWHYCHNGHRCKGNAGLPDLLIAGPMGSVFAELKTENDDTTADQDLWGWTLRQGGQRWFIWRPEHLTDGTIRHILEGITG